MCEIAPEALKTVIVVVAFALAILATLPGDHEMQIVATTTVIQLAVAAKLIICRLL